MEKLELFKGGPPGGHKVCAKTGNFGLGVRVDIGVGGTEKSENITKKVRKSTFQITT